MKATNGIRTWTLLHQCCESRLCETKFFWDWQACTLFCSYTKCSNFSSMYQSYLFLVHT
jgi:hypothetical protein